MSKKFEKISLPKIVSDKSTLVPVELKDWLSFEVKRFYFASDFKDQAGGHCHKEEKEFFILTRGKCTAIIDWGEGLQEFKLFGPNDALFVDNYVWHAFKDFSEDAVLLALSSTNYRSDRSDYIEDYQKFKETVK